MLFTIFHYMQFQHLIEKSDMLKLVYYNKFIAYILKPTTVISLKFQMYVNSNCILSLN